MRLKSAKSFSAFLALLLALNVFAALRTPAQNPDTLLPEESAAKGKQILDQLITALGGPGYLSIHDSDSEARMARFGHSGALTGYTNFKHYWRDPDTNRTDF